MRLLLGDLRDVLPTLEPESVDACVCDPPYELGFMGKAWDRSGVAFQPETWAHVLRVLKPGGYLLAFGGTRTYHRIAVAVEDAGFEVRDQIVWLYGQGFPKSLDASKAIDAALGAEGGFGAPKSASHAGWIARGRMRGDEGHVGYQRPWMEDEDAVVRAASRYLPATEEAARWQGWGTALKPAMEPIVVARKPLAERNVATNLLAYGTGAINVDGCRVGTTKDVPASPSQTDSNLTYGSYGVGSGRLGTGFDPSIGRWPANVVLSHADGCRLVGYRDVRGDGNWQGSTESVGYEGGWDTSDHPRDRRVPAVETVEAWECAPGCPVRLLDEQTGESAGRPAKATMRGELVGSGKQGMFVGSLATTGYEDSGGASRFFYCAKASRAERNAGLDDFEPSFAPTMGNGIGGKEHDPGTATPKRNVHPTVKPVSLMRWLLRLVTPPGGLVLDPFLGSGTTACAAALEGFDLVGVERDPGYLAIAEARLTFWQAHGEDALDAAAARAEAEGERDRIRELGQTSIFD